MNHVYTDEEPSRAELDALPGPTLVEFGAPWCPICQAVQPRLAAVLAGRPDVRHLKIEDGRGKRLGRSFGVTLWPTFVVVDGGQELVRLVRPTDLDPLREALGPPRR